MPWRPRFVRLSPLSTSSPPFFQKKKKNSKTQKGRHPLVLPHPGPHLPRGLEPQAHLLHDDLDLLRDSAASVRLLAELSRRSRRRRARLAREETRNRRVRGEGLGRPVGRADRVGGARGRALREAGAREEQHLVLGGAGRQPEEQQDGRFFPSSLFEPLSEPFESSLLLLFSASGASPLPSPCCCFEDRRRAGSEALRERENRERERERTERGQRERERTERDN